MSDIAAAGAPVQRSRRPRVGFLGVGWIGRHRMEAIANAGAVELAGIADPSEQVAREAQHLAPGAQVAAGLDDLLELDLDGVVIATPSALHAEQSIRALQHGLAVFCQKPLGRSMAEAQSVIDAARAADRLLAVDLSYRFTDAMRRIQAVIRSGELGPIYAVDLLFHNAYGPDKPWSYAPHLSGGGCLMDLGVHLVDLALWTLDFPPVRRISGQLFARGQRLGARPDVVEDYAVATLDLETDAIVQLACSWRLHAGRDAVISARFYGADGGVAMRNVNGSFYDFVAERYRGTARETLAAPPDAWGGRAAADWAVRLAAGERYDASVERLADAAHVLDRIYGR